MEVDKPCVYEIRVEGHLTYRWSEWFEGLAIRNEPNGETTPCGLSCNVMRRFCSSHTEGEGHDGHNSV
jgi:hypothetical protein